MGIANKEEKNKQNHEKKCCDAIIQIFILISLQITT